ncbi:YdbL family protein [Psychromonas hadalis]|uniref:YdbL family protein n=1 Tax=Psychromonas hadalis TaxID=211669 RepID=UPI0003B4153F|nr:YdbL family protein [Psychromonas hadalis]
MKKLFVLCTLILSISTFALDLGDAKEQGIIGEQNNGLLGVVESSLEVEALVKDINQRRLDKYAQIAEKNSMTVKQVSLLAGEKTIKKTPAGQYIQNSTGQWVVK